MRKPNLEELDVSVKIEERAINNLKYAHDTILLAETGQDFKLLISRLKEESEKMGLYLNPKKTKVMTTNEGGTVSKRLNGEEIENVKDFIFLGAKISQNGDCGPDIRRRLSLARVAMTNISPMWKSKDISLSKKYRLVNAIIFPMFMYKCESWTLK